jgi:hypothetical protein
MNINDHPKRGPGSIIASGTGTAPGRWLWVLKVPGDVNVSTLKDVEQPWSQFKKPTI